METKEYIVREVGQEGNITFSQKRMEEVIRCKNCRFWRMNYYEGTETCFENRNVDGHELVKGPDEFCSSGKPKEDSEQ